MAHQDVCRRLPFNKAATNRKILCAHFTWSCVVPIASRLPIAFDFADGPDESSIAREKLPTGGVRQCRRRVESRNDGRTVRFPPTTRLSWTLLVVCAREARVFVNISGDSSWRVWRQQALKRAAISPSVPLFYSIAPTY